MATSKTRESLQASTIQVQPQIALNQWYRFQDDIARVSALTARKWYDKHQNADPS